MQHHKKKTILVIFVPPLRVMQSKDVSKNEMLKRWTKSVYAADSSPKIQYATGLETLFPISRRNSSGLLVRYNQLGVRLNNVAKFNSSIIRTEHGSFSRLPADGGVY